VELLQGEVVHVPRRPGEPECTWADITKIRAELGWQPQVSFAEGAALMLANLDHWRDAPVWEPATIERATKTWFTLLAG
jgi:UDP-glucose 4-epimerase